MSERQSKSDFPWQRLHHSTSVAAPQYHHAPTRRLRVGALCEHSVMRLGYNWGNDC